MGLSKSLLKKWCTSLSKPIISQLLLVNKDILFLIEGNTVIVLDSNGVIKRSIELGTKGIKHEDYFDNQMDSFFKISPVKGYGLVLIGLDDGRLIGLDYKFKKLWQFRTKGRIISTPLIKKNHIFLGSTDGNLYSLDHKGKQLWKFKSGGEIISPIGSIGKNKILFGSEDNYLYCLQIDGSIEWKFKTKGIITAIPRSAILKKGEKPKIIFGSHDKNIYILNEDGSLFKTIPTKGVVVSGVLISDIHNTGFPYVFAGVCSTEQNIIAFNFNTTKEFSLSGFVSGSPVIKQSDSRLKYLVFGSHDHSLYVIEIPDNLDFNMQSKYSKIGIRGRIVSEPQILENQIIVATDQKRVNSFSFKMV